MTQSTGAERRRQDMTCRWAAGCAAECLCHSAACITNQNIPKHRAMIRVWGCIPAIRTMHPGGMHMRITAGSTRTPKGSLQTLERQPEADSAAISLKQGENIHTMYCRC